MARSDDLGLIGKRFGTDFRVVSIGTDNNRTVKLLMQGDYCEIALEELLTIIERGFVSEIPEGPR